MTRKQQQLLSDLQAISDHYRDFIVNSPHDKTFDIFNMRCQILALDKPTARRREIAINALIDRMAP